MFISHRIVPNYQHAPRGAVIVGGGPAGMALLLAASRDGRLEGMLADGLTLVERGPTVGAGELGGYDVISDSGAHTFLGAVRNHPAPEINRLERSPEALALAAQGEAGAPLAQVGAFLALLGATLAGIVEAGGGRVMTGHEALGATRAGEGWTVCVRRLADGEASTLPARDLVIATGGAPAASRLEDEAFAGASLTARCGDRLVRSHDVLSAGGVERLAGRLAGVERPRVAIFGSSTSAVTVASKILKSSLGERLDPGALTLLHRRTLRPFYPSAEAARADGYKDFGPEDICPISGFVYRLAGFRSEARDLVTAALGIGSRRPDPRLRLHRVQPSSERVSLRLLAEADVVIGALGYAPRGLPLCDASGAAIPLAAAGPMVNGDCRVLDTAGAPLPHLFGIGLASGFTLTRAMGGEPSFRGQANGLWLWQTAVGSMIVDQIAQSPVDRIKSSLRMEAVSPLLRRAA